VSLKLFSPCPPAPQTIYFYVTYKDQTENDEKMRFNPQERDIGLTQGKYFFNQAQKMTSGQNYPQERK
jgi:hypothetical protein